MAITDKREISSVVERLIAREAKLYHACQLRDFRSYVALGGVPSRNKLQGSGLDYTVFDTDGGDQEKGVWDKVFGNFSDFGHVFTKPGNRAQPNPYGPIQIVFSPIALASAIDLSITLRSAGARDFDRDRECLRSAQEIENIFSCVDLNCAKNKWEKSYIAFGDELDRRFGRNNCTSPEFNCAIHGEVLNFDAVEYIVVDACLYNGGDLAREVRKFTGKRVYERRYSCAEKEGIIRELSRLSAEYDCSKLAIVCNEVASDRLRGWVDGCNEFYYNRFIRYLTSGTTRA